VSIAGSVSAGVALALVLYTRTGSAAWVGAALLIAFAVPAVFSPVSGLIGDRFDRKRVLVTSDLLGAACFLGMAAVHAPGALLALAFAAALAAAPFLPTSGSLIPAVAPEEDLPWANSRLTVAVTAGRLVAPLIGAGLVAAISGSAAFIANACSFVVSALLISTLGGQFRAAGTEAGAPRFSVTEGFRLLFTHPTLRALTLGFALVDVGNGLVLPAEVPFAHLLGAGTFGYGAMVAMFSVGGLAGAQLYPRTLGRRDEPRVILGAAAGLCVAFVLVAIAPWLAIALAGFAVAGATMAIVQVGEDLVLQRRVSDDVRGRVYAAHIAVVQLSLALPLIVAGALSDALGPRAVFAIAAGSVACGVAALSALLARVRVR
jgi:MFS family permease